MLVDPIKRAATMEALQLGYSCRVERLGHEHAREQSNAALTEGSVVCSWELAEGPVMRCWELTEGPVMCSCKLAEGPVMCCWELTEGPVTCSWELASAKLKSFCSAAAEFARLLLMTAAHLGMTW